MKILLDAMGGDNAPAAQVSAAAEIASDLGAEIILVGREEEINKELSKYPELPGVSVVNAQEVIEMSEEPVAAVKNKKDSSLVVCANMLKENKADAMLSCGSTGALLAASLLIIGRVKGVIRPAIASFLPGKNGPVMLLDMGANTNSKPINLLQFALMGNIYLKNVIGINSPKVGLMSNGTEEGKGNALSKEAYELIKEANLNFAGNIEGRDVMNGDIDIIVCDGFVGNVILKTVEGMGQVIGRTLKDMFKGSIFSSLAALLVYKKIKAFKKKMDYREYGGAPLLGIAKPVVKGHGSSDKKAVIAALYQTKKIAETNFHDILRKELNINNK